MSNSPFESKVMMFSFWKKHSQPASFSFRMVVRLSENVKMSRTVQSNIPKDFGKRVSGENHFLKGSLLTD